MPEIFFTDAVLTAVAAWLVVCAAGNSRNGWLEAALAWCWSLVALVAGAGVILGMTGGFGPVGFLLFHGAVLGLLLFVRRPHRATDQADLRENASEARKFFNASGRARLLGVGLMVLLGGLAVIAATAEPAVLDALTYHLPRIGHWLQDGRIRMLGSPDARLNFVAVLPDIVMAWFVGGAREGFRLAVVPQALGGIMAVGALFGALNTMYSAVSVRTREIATLRAIGFGATAVVLSVLLEAMLLSVMGALIGAGLAWIFFNGNVVSTLGSNFTQVVFRLAVSPALMVLGIIWACVIGLLGGLFPAIRAARLPVATALRAV